MEWPAQLNPSSWILTHLQETAKNTSLPSLFDPLTLALSILLLFYLIFLFKKHKHLTLYRLHIYSLTASFSCKTNTKFLISKFYILVFLNKNKQILPSALFHFFWTFRQCRFGTLRCNETDRCLEASVLTAARRAIIPSSLLLLFDAKYTWMNKSCLV